AAVAGAHGLARRVPDDVGGAQQPVLLDRAQRVPLRHPEVEVGVAGPRAQAAGDDARGQPPTRHDAIQVAVDQPLELLEMDLAVRLYGDHAGSVCTVGEAARAAKWLRY